MIACFRIDQIGIACECLRQSHLLRQSIALEDDGVIVCVSAEARELGIKPTMAVTTAKSIIPSLVVLPYDRKAYMQTAQYIWDAIAVDCNTIEPISPEICYAEFHGTDLVDRLHIICDAIARNIMVTVLVGVGATKLIAKSAIDRQILAEPDRCFVRVVEPSEAKDIVSRVRLTEFRGIPANLIRKLSKLGLRTLGDVGRIDEGELTNQVGTELTYRLKRLVVGLDDEVVRSLWPLPTIEFAITFDDPTDREQAICEAIDECAIEIETKLQSKGLYCHSLSLTVQLADHSFVNQTEKLLTPTSVSDVLYRGGIRLLQRMKVTQAVMMVRLTAKDIDSGGNIQLRLFENDTNGGQFPDENQSCLEARIKTLTSRYGPGAVISAKLLHQARQLGYWTYSFTKQKNEGIKVTFDDTGNPICYQRTNSRRNVSRERQITYTIQRIMDRWRSQDWTWGNVVAVDSYRVMTDLGIFEIHNIGGEWRLRGIAD